MPEEAHYKVNWDSLKTDQPALDETLVIIGWLLQGDEQAMRIALQLLETHALELHVVDEEEGSTGYHFAPGEKWDETYGKMERLGEVHFHEIEVNLN